MKKSMTKSYMNVKTKQNCFLPEIKEMARRFILASAITQEKKVNRHTDWKGLPWWLRW